MTLVNSEVGFSQYRSFPRSSVISGMPQNPRWCEYSRVLVKDVDLIYSRGHWKYSASEASGGYSIIRASAGVCG